MTSPTGPPAPPFRFDPRDVSAHKGDFGRALVVGGSRGMAGSIALSASCALKVGAGLVTAAIPDPCLETVANANLCVMTLPLKANPRGQFVWSARDDLMAAALPCTALAIGPGMGTVAGSHRLVRWALEQTCPKVIDADALNVLASWPDWIECLSASPGPTILTPHPGEWSRLSGCGAADRKAQATHAVSVADRCGAIVMLKGAGTVVTDGNRQVVNSTGNPGMATGGSGDCLTGILCGLLAQGCDPWVAAVMGAWVHGRAGDLACDACGAVSMTAHDLMRYLPAAISEVS